MRRADQDIDRDAKALIRAYGLSVATYARIFWPEGGWYGDRCGCPDARCIGQHHDEDDRCLCLEAVLDHLDTRDSDLARNPPIGWAHFVEDPTGA